MHFLLSLVGCHTETGGPFDFMSDQVGLFSLLSKYWWILIILLVIIFIWGQINKNK